MHFSLAGSGQKTMSGENRASTCAFRQRQRNWGCSRQGLVQRLDSVGRCFLRRVPDPSNTSSQRNLSLTRPFQGRNSRGNTMHSSVVGLFSKVLLCLKTASNGIPTFGNHSVGVGYVNTYPMKENCLSSMSVSPIPRLGHMWSRKTSHDTGFFFPGRGGGAWCPAIGFTTPPFWSEYCLGPILEEINRFT